MRNAPSLRCANVCRSANFPFKINLNFHLKKGLTSILYNSVSIKSLIALTFDGVAGIYVHIPFCKQACTYCDFHFSTNQKLRAPLVDAICQEMEQRKSEIKSPVQSLYFGGGSPSILNASELDQIFEALHQHYDFSEVKEVTLESNPDDHHAEKLKQWLSLGVNRLSIGIQSFMDRDLELMNRAHNAQEADRCVQSARAAGFDALTIDLIYGIPGQSMKQWQSNVQKAVSLDVDHISAYCLTVEERTALHHLVEKGEVEEKDDSVIEKEYLYLHRKLADCGYEHYEISNYAKQGKRALHNSSYWSGSQYLGFGPGAHSFDGKFKRRWNVANNARYINAIGDKEAYFEEELLNADERFNEVLMTELRTKAGVDLSTVGEKHKQHLINTINHQDEPMRSALTIQDERLLLNPERWLMTDAYLRELVV